MKPPIISETKNAKKSDERHYLTSWKEIAEYMRSGVRTVQRYERELGLPVRRPTGKLRGSVMATRAEIDAWIAAGPVRDAFRLVRVEHNALTRKQTTELGDNISEMRKLKEQMQALRLESRSALKLLIDRVSSLYMVMPSSRPTGYEPLVNMDMDMDMDMRRRRKGGGRGIGKHVASASQRSH